VIGAVHFDSESRSVLSNGRACFQSGVPARLEQESVKEGDGKFDGFGRD